MSAWTPALLTGHPLIDDQHREIFARVERLREAMARGDASEVTRLLDFLGRYVVEHFSAEEAVMVSSRFPRYDAHRAQHANFVRDWVAMKQQVAPRGPTPALAAELHAWLTSWLTRHISGSDVQLARHLAGGTTAPHHA